MRKTVVAVLACTVAVVLPSVHGFAQSGDRIDEILVQDELTVGSAAYLAAASAGLVGPDATEAESLSALGELGFPAGTVAIDDPVRLDHFSYMLMLAHRLSGGFMYAIAPGPRYAYREFRYQRVFRGGGDPRSAIDGSLAMRMTGRVVVLAGEE